MTKEKMDLGTFVGLFLVPLSILEPNRNKKDKPRNHLRKISLATLLLGAGISAGYFITKHYHSNNYIDYANYTTDLNNDGIKDLILKHRSEEVTILYGLSQENKVYVSEKILNEYNLNTINNY